MSQIVQGGHSSGGKMDKESESIGNSWDDSISKQGEYKPIRKVGKSFGEHASEYPVVVEGMESSGFLWDLVAGVKKSLDAFEESMARTIDAHFAENDEFDKSLGHAVMYIGEGVHSLQNRLDVLEESTEMQKSLHEKDLKVISKGMLQDPDNISRTEVLDAMIKAVEAGNLDHLEVVKFETTGEINETIAKSIGLEVR